MSHRAASSAPEASVCRMLHVYEWGDPAAPPVVCLHGISSYGGRFGGLAEQLADRFHVLAPDLLGHGASDWEPPWGIDAHLDAVVDATGVERGIWLGHSFGGRLVAELAAREPERVERLVLLDPALRVLPHVAADMAEQACHDLSFDSVEEAVELRYETRRVLLAPRELVIESDRPHLEPGPDGRLRYRYSRPAVVTAWSEMATQPPPPARVPTLVVLGAESWLVPDEELAEYHAELGDELLTVVTVPGGHTVYWDAFAETAEAVEAFLSS